MPVHVLDHDDRVVDHDAGDEDQREQRHAVQRVAEELVDEEREREGDRHRDHHDHGAAPTHRQGHDEADGKNRQQQVGLQRRHLLTSRLAVVPRDQRLDLVG